MNLEDRLYSESELRGKPSTNPETERLYSNTEISEISDLFDEFYGLHGESYSDVNEAYDEFMEAFSNLNNSEEDDTYAVPLVPKAATQAAVTAVGAGAGYGLAKLANKKMEAEKKLIERKMTMGQASSGEIKRLVSIKKKIAFRKIAATVGGGALALGATAAKASNTNNSEIDSEEEFVEDTYPIMTTAALIGGAKLVGAGIAAGGTVGNVVARVKNRKAQKRINYLKSKGDSNLTFVEKSELNKLKNEFNSKLYKSTGRGAVVGGATALGGAAAGGLKAAAAAKALLAAKAKAAAAGVKVAAGTVSSAVTGVAGAGAAGGSAGYFLNKKDKKSASNKVAQTEKDNKNLKIGGGAVLGAGAGYGISHLATKTLKSKIKTLKDKNKLTVKEMETLKKLNTKLVNIQSASTVGGAVLGGGIGAISSRKPKQ
jgi:hypothetical protein